MGFRWLLNFVLLAIPIGVTLGVLLGIQTHRTANGQSPLFVDNGVTKKQYCQKTIGISPPSKGEHFTLNPNQWGWKEGSDGSLCLNVTTFNNQTYASDYTAPEFSITWQYPPGPETQPVHAFPNVKVDSGVFPSSLQSIEQVMVDLEWSYGIGNKTSATTDKQDLTDNLVNTNVAFDMFLDSDRGKSEDSAKAGFEIMVWFAAFGPATQPIGFADGSVDTQTVDGTEFSLYTGQNGVKQQVLTWYAETPTESFKGDIAPLMKRLASMAGSDLPKGSDYLGYMSLGSEALSADVPVTFHVPTLSIEVKTT